VGENVEAVNPINGDQRRLDQLLVHLVREVCLERAAVQVELSGARDQAHAHHGFLATSDSLNRTVDQNLLARRGLDLVELDGYLCCLSHCDTCLISY